MTPQELFSILGYLLSFGIGMGCGSYATMLYYRMPRGEGMPKGKNAKGEWIGERAHCTNCGATLRTRDLLPIFNWLITGGKCYNCGSQVSWHYFVIELGITLCSVGLFYRYGFTPEYFYSMIVAVVLVSVTMSNISVKSIPDSMVITIAAAAFMKSTSEGFFDMILLFTTAVLLGLALARMYENKHEKLFPRYDALKLLAAAGLWFTGLEFGLFIVITGLAVGFLWLNEKLLKRECACLPISLPVSITFLALLFVV